MKLSYKILAVIAPLLLAGCAAHRGDMGERTIEFRGAGGEVVLSSRLDEEMELRFEGDSVVVFDGFASRKVAKKDISTIAHPRQ